jgi:hypothetical protein
MTPKERKATRNTKQPISQPTHHTMHEITTQILHTLANIQHLRLTPPNETTHTNHNITLPNPNLIQFTNTTTNLTTTITFNQFTQLLQQHSNNNKAQTLQHILTHIHSPTHSTQPTYYQYQQAHAWIITHQMHNTGMDTRAQNNAIFALKEAITFHKQTNNTHDIIDAISPYKKYIYIPIDHNNRQVARLCPVRLHHAILTTYIHDITHYTTLSPQQAEQHIQNITNTRQKHWFPHTIKKDKPQTLPNLYLIIKPDGIRFRTI